MRVKNRPQACCGFKLKSCRSSKAAGKPSPLSAILCSYFVRNVKDMVIWRGCAGARPPAARSLRGPTVCHNRAVITATLLTRFSLPSHLSALRFHLSRYVITPAALTFPFLPPRRRPSIAASHTWNPVTPLVPLLRLTQRKRNLRDTFKRVLFFANYWTLLAVCSSIMIRQKLQLRL